LVAGATKTASAGENLAAGHVSTAPGYSAGRIPPLSLFPGPILAVEI
jgi:hypothetical protein